MTSAIAMLLLAGLAQVAGAASLPIVGDPTPPAGGMVGQGASTTRAAYSSYDPDRVVSCGTGSVGVMASVRYEPTGRAMFDGVVANAARGGVCATGHEEFEGCTRGGDGSVFCSGELVSGFPTVRYGYYFSMDSVGRFTWWFYQDSHFGAVYRQAEMVGVLAYRNG